MIGDVSMEDIPTVAKRISDKIQEKGAKADIAVIERKLTLLVKEFCIPLEEAERTVTNELHRELKLGTVQSASAGKRPIRDLAPGDWVTIEAKVVSLSTPRSPAIAQNGILADESGAIQFVIWAKAGAPKLEERQWYRFEAATIDDFRGAPNLKVHSGTTIETLDDDRPLMPATTPIAELRPGVVSVRAKVVQEWEKRHERMVQSGLLGDESGTASFVIWADSDREKLETDKVYEIYYAAAEEFNGRISLNLTNAMYLAEEGDIEVSRGTETLSGAMVHIGPGSGLIKRCPVEGCNRVLSNRNYCPVHEIQTTFRYDLRIKGVLDDGLAAKNVLLQREATEKISALTLEDAITIAENNPLGYDDVLVRIQEAVLGRYYTCSGSDIEGTMLVKECTRQGFDSTRHATLINRSAPIAGGELP